MIVSERVSDMIGKIPQGVVFKLPDLGIERRYYDAVAKSLSRMVARGKVTRLSKGKYYKPKSTPLGYLLPSQAELLKDLLVRNGRLVGYVTGTQAFTSMGLTTQISSTVIIGTSSCRRPLEINGTKVFFVSQRNAITESNIELLRVLDALRSIKEIPAATPDDVCGKVRAIVAEMDASQRRELVTLSFAYRDYVRAILGAMLEDMGIDVSNIKESLNKSSRYNLPISASALPNKSRWRIYDLARRQRLV